MSDTETTPITRDDIEAKFVELQHGVDNAAASAKDATAKIGIAALVILLILVFILGRRRGQQNKTVVEIRRV